MVKAKYNRLLLALIIVGLLAALFINYERYLAEKSNSQVEMVMDYEDIVELAQIEGHSVADLMQKFKQAGVTSLAVYERTFEKLNKSGKVTAVSGAQLLHDYRAGIMSDPFWLNIASQNILLADSVYVIGQNDKVFGEVREDLLLRLGADRVRTIRSGEHPVIEIKANYEKVLKWNLGLPSDEMEEVSARGFFVVARPTNYTKVQPQDVQAVFARINNIKNVSTIMFVGQEALGWPDLMTLTAAEMKAQNYTLGMIEHPLQLQFVKQEGLLPLAEKIGYQAARVYVIPKDEQPKLKVDEAVHRWAITDEERNIRINFLRKFEKAEPGKDLIETNLEYIAKVKKQVEDRGFTIGRASYFKPYFPSTILLAIIITGATAAGCLYLTMLYPIGRRYQYILLVIIAAVLIFPVMKGAGTLSRQAAGLASAILFPVLAMTYQLDRWKNRELTNSGSLMKIIVDGVGGLTLTVFLAMIGGAYVGALLGDVRFFLEMQIYRGVKLTFVAPLILITLVYLTRFNLFQNIDRDSRGVWGQLIKVLDYPVYIKTLLIFAAGAIVGWIFVGRSGHTAGVPVPAVELKLRAFLEKVMYARPREKEFMIGHPAFFLAVMAMYRNWPRMAHYILVVAATIGQGSLVETFAHMRTPVIMSFIRGLDGLALGIPLGIAAVVGVQVLHYSSYLLGRRPSADE